MEIRITPEELLISLIILFAIAILVIISITNNIMHRYMQKMLESDEQLREELREENQEFLKQMMKSSYKEVIKDKAIEQQSLFTVFAKLRDSIKLSTIRTQEAIHADRIAIYLFHNGNSSTHGIKFFKMSCICEKVTVGSGVREQSIDQSNIPINLFDNMVDHLIDNGRYIILNDDELESSNHRIFISAKKIKYSQAVAIFDTSNNILGFVLAEMAHDYSIDMAKEEFNTMTLLVEQLRPILSYSDYTTTVMNQHD